MDVPRFGFFSTLFVALLLIGSTDLDPPHPSADDLAIHWAVETNLVDDGSRFRSRLTIRNRGTVPLGRDGWTIYFNFLREIDTETVRGPVRLTRINGDFYRLEPGTAFESVSPGTEVAFTFETPGSAIKHIDAPSGFYVVYTDAQGEPAPPASISAVTVEPFSRPEQTTRGPDDNLPVPTAARRYRDNQSLTSPASTSGGRIVPTPVSSQEEPGSFALSAEDAIQYEEGLASEARQLAAGLASVLGRRPPTTRSATDPAITLRRGPVPSPDSHSVHGAVSARDSDAVRIGVYRLSIDPKDGIDIVGTTSEGVFYGIQSLEAWLPLDTYTNPSSPVSVPAGTLVDAPRFPYRGLHLDVSRNFQSVEAVKRLLDIMAAYKLNTFHFHLTDDEGWRIAIDGLPELTRVGGRRGHTRHEHNHLVPSHGSGPNPSPDASPGSGWYSRADYLEILRYAKARHITVMPEIDVPGHARAAIQAMKARGRRLRAAGDTAAASRFRLHDPNDESTYESIQGWDDNVINVCQPSTYRFLTTVVDELQALHETADAPLSTVHVGGDEVPEGVWTGSPICNDYIAQNEDLDDPGDLFGHFLTRFQDSLAVRGLTMAGWEEVGLEEADHQAATTTPNRELADEAVRPYVWSNIWGSGTEDRAYQLANAGYDVVMSQATNFYFDMAYSKHPREAGLYWADFVDTQDPFAFVPFNLYKSADRTAIGQPIDPAQAFADHARLADSARARILGLQGQLWSETLRSTDRLEYMAVPRLLGLAERAWAPQPEWALIEDIDQLRSQRSRDWSTFAHQLGHRELRRLSIRHPAWSYRLPPPGAVIQDGRLYANVALPGLPIRYTTDGTRPTSTSPRYMKPVPVSDTTTVKLRTFDSFGRGGRTVTLPRPK